MALIRTVGTPIRQLFCCVTLWYFFTVCYWKWPIEIVDLPMRVIFWIWASCDQQWFSSQENVGERSFDASGLDQQYFLDVWWDTTINHLFVVLFSHWTRWWCWYMMIYVDNDLMLLMMVIWWRRWCWWGSMIFAVNIIINMVDCDINDVRTPGSVRRSQATAGFISPTECETWWNQTVRMISWWFVSMQFMVRNASTQLID